MTNFVNSSALTKLLAALFVFILLLAAVGITCYDTLKGLPTPEFVTGLLEAGMVAALTVLGVHLGSVQTLNAQAPMTTPGPSQRV